MVASPAETSGEETACDFMRCSAALARAASIVVSRLRVAFGAGCGILELPTFCGVGIVLRVARLFALVPIVLPTEVVSRTTPTRLPTTGGVLASQVDEVRRIVIYIAVKVQATPESNRIPRKESSPS